MQLGRLHEASHHGAPLAGDCAALKKPSFPAHGRGPHQVLDVVVVDGHFAV